MENTVANITDLIAKTQDGNVLKATDDDFSHFILQRIDSNTQDDLVDVETLIEDFNYMINQLQQALVPLKNL